MDKVDNKVAKIIGITQLVLLIIWFVFIGPNTSGTITSIFVFGYVFIFIGALVYGYFKQKELGYESSAFLKIAFVFLLLFVVITTVLTFIARI